MDWLQTIFLALLQGLTEFLPISSSAHLILPAQLFGWADQGLAFDVAVHVGTLLAVVLYFRRDVQAMIRAWLGSVAKGEHNEESRLAWYVILGTIPVGLAGLAMMLGMTRTAAARFSFLLSIPVIVLAGSLKTLELFESVEPVLWGHLLLGTLISFGSAYLCIGWFLRMLEKVGMLPFVFYRLLLGIILLVFFV